MELKEIYIGESIETFYVMAKSFPEGIQAATQKLHSLLPDTAGRTFYGISRPNHDGVIEYKAAVAQVFAGEAEKYGCPSFTIPAGTYISTVITNWQQNIPQIEPAFDALLETPAIDPEGYCIEWYKRNTELLCMVRLVK